MKKKHVCSNMLDPWYDLPLQPCIRCPHMTIDAKYNDMLPLRIPAKKNKS
jgi:hypothetical protein